MSSSDFSHINKFKFNIKNLYSNSYLLLIAILLYSCSGTKINRYQTVPLSQEAVQFIKKHRARRIPLFKIPHNLSTRVREKLNRENNLALEDYLKSSGVSIRMDSLNGIAVAIYTPPTGIMSDQAIGFYIHGGAFILGSSRDFLCADMCKRLGITIVSVEYPFSPAFPFPAAVSDCFHAYVGLTLKYPHLPILAFGSSAGGNLVLTTLLKAQTNHFKMPAAIALFSPWTDITGSGDSYTSNRNRDAIITWKSQIKLCAKTYIGKNDPKNPIISPVYGTYNKDFPPTMISTGTRDLLLSDCTRLYWNLRNSGIPVELRIWEGMWHAFDSEQNIPEAVKCRTEMSNFLKQFITIPNE